MQASLSRICELSFVLDVPTSDNPSLGGVTAATWKGLQLIQQPEETKGDNLVLDRIPTTPIYQSMRKPKIQPLITLIPCGHNILNSLFFAHSIPLPISVLIPLYIIQLRS